MGYDGQPLQPLLVKQLSTFPHTPQEPWLEIASYGLHVNKGSSRSHGRPPQYWQTKS